MKKLKKQENKMKSDKYQNNGKVSSSIFLNGELVKSCRFELISYQHKP